MMIADADSEEPVDANSGHWRRPWSPQVQSHWLEAVFQIALSKPFVEGVSWAVLHDHPAIELPLSGLVGEEMQPKPALKRAFAFRQQVRKRPTGAMTPDHMVQQLDVEEEGVGARAGKEVVIVKGAAPVVGDAGAGI